MQVKMVHFWCHSGSFCKMHYILIFMVNNIILKVLIIQLVFAYEDICIIVFENKALNVINELLKCENMD
jgi:hypothetical protein